jgi:hypothetical protein
MAIVSVTNTFVNNTSADASEVNQNFGDLVDFVNDEVLQIDGSKALSSNLDVGSNKIINVSTGTADTDAVNKLQMSDAITVVSDAVTAVEASVTAITDAVTLGAWVSHNPTISQGTNFNISKTINYSKYCRIGNTVIWSFDLSVTGTGTSGVAILYTPIEAASTFAWNGSGQIYDSSTTTRYEGSWGSRSSSVDYVALYPDGSFSGPFGVTPGTVLTSGDKLTGTIIYEGVAV